MSKRDTGCAGVGVLKAALLAAFLVVLAADGMAAQGTRPEQRPAGVTDSSIAWGRELFHGSANCAGCHGEGGRGTDYGPNLTGAIWLHGPGTYQSLIEQVKHGVSARRSYTGEAMPMRGMVPMPEEAVHAVAAYVWSISHPPQPPPPSGRKPPPG
jgi:mono/diheme cytochrome c family protein